MHCSLSKYIDLSVRSYNSLFSGRVLSGMELVFVMFLVLFSGVGTGILCFNAVWQTGLNGINYSHLLDNELWREADGKLPKYAAADSVSCSQSFDRCERVKV